MPYIKEGGQKFTSHRITSPLSDIANTCQVCHRESEEQLRENVYERQEKIKELRDKAETELVYAHLEAKAAWDAGAREKEMEPPLRNIRNAQWYWDYAVASHGAAFHSPVEVARLMGNSMSESQQSRVQLVRILARYGKLDEIPYPDLSTKAKAQQFIGLEMDKLNKEKEEFRRTIIPLWDQQARERESKWEGIEDEGREKSEK
jgi:nitrite reductase (cytochrome c-552)